jgi:anti-sigma28 factor (negative regulator of flagellin synthesis)
MTDLRASWANVDRATGTEEQRQRDAMLSLAQSRALEPASTSDARMERVSELRRAIQHGQYSVRSTDLAEKILSTMREGPILRFCGNTEDSQTSA